MESSINKLRSSTVEWIELLEGQTSQACVLTHIYTIWPRGKCFTCQLINLPEHVQELGYIAAVQVSMYVEYDKGLLNIERIQLFLPTTFCKDHGTGHLIIWPPSQPR